MPEHCHAHTIDPFFAKSVAIMRKANVSAIPRLNTVVYAVNVPQATEFSDKILGAIA